MGTKTPVSPARSWQGWRVGELLRRNKDLIKAVVALIVTLLTGGLTKQVPWGVALTAAGVSLVALLGKFGTDAVDFYLTRVDL